MCVPVCVPKWAVSGFQNEPGTLAYVYTEIELMPKDNSDAFSVLVTNRRDAALVRFAFALLSCSLFNLMVYFSFLHPLLPIISSLNFLSSFYSDSSFFGMFFLRPSLFFVFLSFLSLFRGLPKPSTRSSRRRDRDEISVEACSFRLNRVFFFISFRSIFFVLVVISIWCFKTKWPSKDSGRSAIRKHVLNLSETGFGATENHSVSFSATGTAAPGLEGQGWSGWRGAGGAAQRVQRRRLLREREDIRIWIQLEVKIHVLFLLALQLPPYLIK